MKRRSRLPVALIALVALAPFPAVADGAGPRAASAPKPDDPAYEGFETAQNFFGLFLSSGKFFQAAMNVSDDEIDTKNYVNRSKAIDEEIRKEKERENSQRAISMLRKERRERAERSAREAEKERKAAENRSEDDLPGLDY